MIFDIVGLIGGALMVGGFAYANTAKELNKVLFSLLNLAGAVLLLTSLWVKFNLAAFVLEAVWGVIALVGLVMAIRARRSPSRLREGLGVGQSEAGTSPPPAPPASGRGEA